MVHIGDVLAEILESYGLTVTRGRKAETPDGRVHTFDLVARKKSTEIFLQIEANERAADARRLDAFWKAVRAARGEHGIYVCRAGFDEEAARGAADCGMILWGPEELERVVGRAILRDALPLGRSVQDVLAITYHPPVKADADPEPATPPEAPPVPPAALEPPGSMDPPAPQAPPEAMQPLVWDLPSTPDEAPGPEEETVDVPLDIIPLTSETDDQDADNFFERLVTDPEPEAPPSPTVGDPFRRLAERLGGPQGEVFATHPDSQAGRPTGLPASPPGSQERPAVSWSPDQGAILEPQVTRALAETIGRDRIFVVESVAMRLRPVHVYSYSVDLMVDGRLGHHRVAGAKLVDATDGSLRHRRRWEQASTRNSLEVDVPIAAARRTLDADEAHRRVVAAIAEEASKEVTVEDVDQQSDYYMITKRKVRVATQDVSAVHEGLFWQPVWHMESVNGSIEIDAVTGEILTLDRRNRSSNTIEL